MKRKSFYLAIVALILFCLVTQIFGPINQPFYFDQWIYQKVSSIDAKPWFFFWQIITFLGDAYFIFPLAFLIMIILIQKNYILEGISYFLLIAISLQCNSALKIYFNRERPLSLVDGLQHYSLSFPSGHTLGSIVFYFSSAVILLNLYPQFKNKKSKTYLLMTIICILVGLSRILLGAHWFSDVLGGSLLGVAWLSMAHYLFNRSKTYYQFKRDVSV